MASHIENGRDDHTLGIATLRPGHRISEIRRHLHDRHPGRARYQVIPTHHPPAGGASFAAMASAEYQTHLYWRSRKRDVRVRLAAIREAIAASPHVWDDLSADGVQEGVESSIEDDALLVAAVDSLGDLNAEERPYFGKFLAETYLRDADGRRRGLLAPILPQALTESCCDRDSANRLRAAVMDHTADTAGAGRVWD
ncbi:MULTISPECIES: hypothetical protein [Micrococcaceae]|uniref:hypothetical protein n=1 Tax=Micrococcaceae TaxID=1268 RepID=UPI001492DE77|nr:MULTISPECIES: hypothetical protein [Micrococcaceae]MCR1163290.1 hypothetical protein [Paenarthrobacter sp. UW852]NOJ63985.1 hypothetical protein [Arthrobacter sp. 147(2020)]